MDNRNLITALVIAALITLAATAAGCTTNTSPSPTPIAATQTTIGNNTTFSSGAGFNITYPSTLSIDSSTNASSPVKVYIYQNSNSKIDGVNVGTYSLSAGQKLSDFVNFNLNALQTNSSSGFYKNFTILNETNLTFSGQPAHQIVFQGIIPQQISAANATNTSVKETQIWVVNNNTGYVVTYKAIPSDYDTYLAQAEGIINSFKLT
jgi:hypothetical protein